MANMQFEDNRQVEPKTPITNEDINERLAKVESKLDQLSTSLGKIEKKIELLLSQTQKSVLKNEVEIEQNTVLEENYLTPNDIINENPAIHNTGIELIKMRIATATEIAQITKKERAVESFYLNDLSSRNRIRKIRIGRKIYFYIGKTNEIMPFKNPNIKPGWRDVLVSIIRELLTFETDSKIKFSRIIKNYRGIIQSDEAINDSINDQDIEKNLKNIILDMTENTSYIKYKEGNEKIEFFAQEWLKLG